jgi:hypothetical protein
LSDLTYIYTLHDPRDWSIRYVGKANDPVSRLKVHIRQPLLIGMRRFVDDLRIVGMAPTLNVLQITSQSQWKYWEQFWIATVRASGADLLNIAKGGNGCQEGAGHAGIKHSAQTRTKFSLQRKGRVLSPEWRANVSASLKGIKRNPESVARSAQSRKGRKHSLESRAKMSASLKGRTYSAETRALWSVQRKGRPHSKDHSAKIGAALKGRVILPEWRAKISATLKRRNHADSSGI